MGGRLGSSAAAREGLATGCAPSWHAILSKPFPSRLDRERIPLFLPLLLLRELMTTHVSHVTRDASPPKSKPVSSAAPPPRCRPYRRLWSAFGPPFTRSSCRSTSSRRRSCSRACVDRTFQSTLPSRAFLKKAVSSPVCTVSSRLTCTGTVCPLACCTAVRGPGRDHTE
jgi:hypothetical protein